MILLRREVGEDGCAGENSATEAGLERHSQRRQGIDFERFAWNDLIAEDLGLDDGARCRHRRQPEYTSLRYRGEGDRTGRSADQARMPDEVKIFIQQQLDIQTGV